MFVIFVIRSPGNLIVSITIDVDSNQHTFLNKRFDRTNTGERIHFASATTLLGYSDGAGYKEDGVGYLELAELISRSGAKPTQDSHQLWRSIVFISVYLTQTIISEIMDFFSLTLARSYRLLMMLILSR